MKLRLKQLFCGILFGHVIYDKDRIVKYNEDNHTYTIIVKCCKCGKVYSFTSEERLFGE